jgi:hypothetical protein
MPRSEGELSIQSTFIEWCWDNWRRWPDVAIEIPRRVRLGRKTIEILAKSVPFFHPANGEVRDARTGNKLNKQGLRKGVLDLIMGVPRGGYTGLIIEVKTAKGKISPFQKIWIEFFRHWGWKVEVCRSFAECVDVTVRYLDSK